MRLLHTTEPHFEEFFQRPGDDGFPKYAILSHRWVKDELTYEEMEYLLLSEEDRARVLTPRLLKLRSKIDGPGHKKVVEFRDLAATAGYEWVWIDTVCIDKTSSAELSEAINSMWNWYSWAALCYAYLVDVDCCHSECRFLIKFEDCCSDSRDNFRDSEWHRRGWTLQELLAPRLVIFVDRGWHRIGNKQELAKELASITGIPENYTLGYLRNEDFSVAERLSWAAHRLTSRVEDRAYCLLGLFSINIPLLYGEGPNAFRRLGEEILRKADDPTIFAHGSPSLAGMLPQSASDFRIIGDSHCPIYEHIRCEKPQIPLQPRYTVYANSMLLENVPSLVILAGALRSGERMIMSIILLPSVGPGADSTKTTVVGLVCVENEWDAGVWIRCGVTDRNKAMAMVIPFRTTALGRLWLLPDAVTTNQSFLVRPSSTDDMTYPLNPEEWFDIEVPTWHVTNPVVSEDGDIPDTDDLRACNETSMLEGMWVC